MRLMMVVKDSTITTCAMAGLGSFSHGDLSSSTGAASGAGFASPNGFAAAPDLANGEAPALGAAPNAPVSAKGEAPAAGGLGVAVAPRMGTLRCRRAERAGGLRAGGGRGGAEGGGGRGGGGVGGRCRGRGLLRGGVEGGGGHVEGADRLSSGLHPGDGFLLERVLEGERLLARRLALAEGGREGLGGPLASLRHRRLGRLRGVVLRRADDEPSPRIPPRFADPTPRTFPTRAGAAARVAAPAAEMIVMNDM